MTALRRRLRNLLIAACLAGAAFVHSGCVSSILANMAITAPNQQHEPRTVSDPAYAARFDSVCAQTWRLPVGPPPAELAISVVEPGNYDFYYKLEPKESKGWKWLEPDFTWKLPPKPLAAKGTLVLLHGWGDEKENMMHWALCLAENGWRCVLVDLRGHGRSTGSRIGFGAFEVGDLRQVLDEIQRRKLAGDKVGIVGVSYGASMGLLLAAQDPRVGAIVALEPFSIAAHAVVEFAHGAAPQQAAGISEKDFATAVKLAAERGGFSWEQGDVLAAMEHVTAPVLFIHGAKDTWISPENSRILQAHAHGPSRLLILPDDDHVFLSMRLGEVVVSDVRGWFDRYLGPETAAVAP